MKFYFKRTMTYIQIFVVALDGNSITIELDSEDTVATLIELINQKKGYPPDIYNIRCNGKYLRKNEPISKYNIVKECTVRLAPILAKRFTFLLYVHNDRAYGIENCRLNNTIHDIREKIKYQYPKLHVDQARFIVDGKLANENDTCKNWTQQTKIVLA